MSSDSCPALAYPRVGMTNVRLALIGQFKAAAGLHYGAGLH